MNPRLLIVGGDVRPWLASARRTGFAVCAFDFFADWDGQWMLQGKAIGPHERPLGTVERIDRFEDVIRSQAAMSCDQAIICGGLENHTDLVRQIGERVTVLGSAPDALERVAATVDVFDRLESAGFQVPTTKIVLTAAEANAGWLRKTTRSSGGMGVRSVRAEDLHQPNSTDLFFQQKIDGDSISSLYVSSRDANDVPHTWLLGITRQLVGEQSFGAADFRYCGSVGPIQLPAEAAGKVLKLGQFLADQYNLLGVWGIDWIVNPLGVWPVDVNPRITASAELFEACLLNSPALISGIVELHVRACDRRVDVSVVSDQVRLGSLGVSAARWSEGKAVLFHCGNNVLPISEGLFIQLRADFSPGFFDSIRPGWSIADVPCPGQNIEVGQPILTLRVRCQTEQEVRPMLSQKAKQIYDLLGLRTVDG